MLKSRRQSSQDIQEGTIDDFMNRMGLGDPDPSNYKTGFDGADEIIDWFDKINQMIGGNVTKFLMFTKNLDHVVWSRDTHALGSS